MSSSTSTASTTSSYTEVTRENTIFLYSNTFWEDKKNKILGHQVSGPGKLFGMQVRVIANPEKKTVVDGKPTTPFTIHPVTKQGRAAKKVIGNGFLTQVNLRKDIDAIYEATGKEIPMYRGELTANIGKKERFLKLAGWDHLATDKRKAMKSITEDTVGDSAQVSSNPDFGF